MPPPDPPVWFQVSYVGQAVGQSERLLARAEAAAVAAEWAATRRRIVARLAADPRGAGDPERSLPRLRLMVYNVIIDRVWVQYAVHDIQPVVLVRDLKPVLGHPLEEPGPGGTG